VAALFLGKVVTEKMADTATKLVEVRLKRAEELHKSPLAFTSVVDTDLRTRRIPVYAELWEKTGLLPMWRWNTELEYEALHQLTCDFRNWYFKRGGMYLSTSARDAYFEVQKCINAILDKMRLAESPLTTIRQSGISAARSGPNSRKTSCREERLPQSICGPIAN
jgi:hypothetical protein